MKKKRFLCVLTFMILALVTAFAGCSPSDSSQSSSSGGGSNKPGTGKIQDLSRFDNIQHYGFSSKPKYTLTIDTEGASFSGGKKSVKLQENAMLPEIEYTGQGYVGGVKLAGQDKVYETYRFRMPAKDAAIEAIITDTKPELFQNLNINTAYNGSIGPDYDSAGVKSVESGSPFVIDDAFKFNIKDKNADVNGNSTEDFLRGIIFEVSGSAGDFARLLTGCGDKDTEKGIIAGSTYTFTYNFENKGEKDISFKMYQLQSNIVLSGSVMVNAGKNITLKPGESVSYNVEFTANNSNANIMPVFQLQSEADKALIGIAVGKANGAKTHEHKIQKIEEGKGLCTGTGNKEYFGCVGCGKMYADENGTTVVTMLNVGIKGEHNYNEWKSTETEHYRECADCHKKADKAEHTFEFVTTKESTETEKGLKEEICSVCGYKSGKTQEIDIKKTHKLKVIGENGLLGEYDLMPGVAIPTEAIDENAIGYYNGDDITEFGNIEDFVMPDKNYNLVFYYKDNTTAQKLLPGSFKTGDYKSDEVTTEAANAIIDGKLGTLMTITGKSGDYFRFVTKAGTSATALGIQAGRTYRFDYTFVNYGTGGISFKVIGVQTGALMTEEDGAVISETITLKAGEKKNVSMTITLEKDNANVMSCISMISAFNESKLGVYMTKTNADAAEHMHTLTLDSTVNATFADGKKSISLEWGSEMPEVVFADINFEYGGWYDVKDLSKSFVKGKFVMPDGDITVATLKSASGVALDFGFKTDNIKNLTYDGSSRKDGVVGGYKGREVTIKPTAKGSGTIRFQSKFGATKTVGGMTFVYTIENRGKTKVKFTLNQVNSGTNVLAGASANVELEAGETKTYTITMPDIGGTNANALSYMQFTFEDTSDVVLGIALSYTEKK